MDNNLYEMIFKRKSFHLFRNVGSQKISEEEIKDIENKFNDFKPLVDDIKVKIKIVKDSTTCKRGQEYCILFYSEKKDNYLQNIGYLGEQLDLYLVSKNIGTLWFGIGKPKEHIDMISHVIGHIPEEEIETLEKGTTIAKDATIEIIKNGIGSAMNKFNKKAIEKKEI